MSAETGPVWRPTAKNFAQLVVGLGLSVILLVWGLPHFAKTTWSEVWAVLVDVPPLRAAEFLGLVLIGLWWYTFTLTGSMPGLSHARAFIVNIAGSSVSNVLPGGGAVGLAATFAICRSWGFSNRAISTSGAARPTRWTWWGRAAGRVAAPPALRRVGAPPEPGGRQVRIGVV